jgi:pyruvate formate lyase activating enzyme
MSVDQILAAVSRDVIFYDQSQGGVTFSGGEPLMQPQFLVALLEACRAKAIHTAVDTCGYTPREHLQAVAPLTDLFLYDLKFMDEAGHLQYTGVSNAIILENLKCLGQIHDTIWIRIPIIPAVNNADDQLENMARFVASIHGVRQIHLLPYHTAGISKFHRLGTPYRLVDAQPPSVEFMESAATKFNAFGLKVKVGG